MMSTGVELGTRRGCGHVRMDGCLVRSPHFQSLWWLRPLGLGFEPTRELELATYYSYLWALSIARLASTSKATKTIGASRALRCIDR